MSRFRPIIIVLLVIFFCKNSKGVKGSTFTFINKCDQTIWPGILGNPTLDSTGFELKQGDSRTFQAPTGWSGRFWGRTGCNFDGSGHGSCSTGDCGSGEIECNGSGATPPATLAEFTLGSGSQDFYDVSLVDGYNLAMMVDVIGGSSGSDSVSGTCSSTGCIEDLNQKCPKELRVDGGGACRSACDAFGTAEYCCKGEYGSPATCAPSVYSELFKSACPKSYSYAYDDASSTFTCTGADYTITFCPSGTSKRSSKSSDIPVGGGSGPDPDLGSGTESGSGSGSAGEAMLADGSWLANLATGESLRMDPLSTIQVLAFVIVIIVSIFIG